MKEIENAKAGQNQPNMSTPKTFAWLASLTLIGLIAAAVILPHGNSQLLKIAGVILLALAAALIFIPIFQLSKFGNKKDETNYMETTTVVDQGLYGIIRHPQYLGYMLMAIGFAGITQQWVIYLITVVTITFFYIQSVQEERHCTGRFSESYNDYLERVPRFNLFLGIWRKARKN